LDKPTWQPPGAAFGPVWTVLYGLIAVAAARSLDRLEEPEDRHAFATAFGANLVLNASWNWLFFRARRPRLALAEILLLQVSSVDLARRAAKTDAPASAMLVPYAAWVAFAGVLNAAIARRNPGR
jgi:tryptophan-rich sensory protein